jgi:hypothetical protein
MIGGPRPVRKPPPDRKIDPALAYQAVEQICRRTLR